MIVCQQEIYVPALLDSRFYLREPIHGLGCRTGDLSGYLGVAAILYAISIRGLRADICSSRLV
jgi:hypothetical protein